jgi:hypothetical protein
MLKAFIVMFSPDDKSACKGCSIQLLGDYSMGRSRLYGMERSEATQSFVLVINIIKQGTKMRVAIVIVFLLILMARTGLAAEPAEIELRDGSIIRAEIISLQDDFYTVKSQTLGTIRIEKSRIKSIRMGPGDTAGKSVTTPSPAPDVAAQVKTQAEALMRDPSIMDTISSLTQNEDVMRVMQDPAIMKAINEGDIATLMSNDKFMQILNDPNIQAIVKKASP